MQRLAANPDKKCESEWSPSMKWKSWVTRSRQVLAHRVMGHLFISLSRQQLHPTPPYPHPHQPSTARLSASHRRPCGGLTLMLVPTPLQSQTERFSGSYSLVLSLVSGRPTFRLCWGARWQEQEFHALVHLCCFRHMPENWSLAERTYWQGWGGVGGGQEPEVPSPGRVY